MRFSRQHADAGEEVAAEGTLRVDRRLSSLLRTLRPGDIAVVDHLDLDRRAADALLDHGVSAVVNASPFISGRFPNLGPERLATAGVVLVDQVGAEAVAKAKSGARARIVGGTVHVGATAVLTGRLLSLEDVRAQMDAAREGLSTQLQSFAHNTTEYLRRDQDLLLHGLGAPDLRTDMDGRAAVVVVRAFDHEDELRRIKEFVREQKPVLVGVDAGADALLDFGWRPDLVVVGEEGIAGSDGASPVSEKALKRAREVVLHTDSSERAAGADKLERLGVRAARMAAEGTTEDAALMLADVKGASLIVSVGTHATLDEFLDRHHGRLASTFLTRLRVGPRLVDARSVPVLYAGRVRLWQLALVLLAGLIALLAAVATTPRGEDWVDDLRTTFRTAPSTDPVVDPAVGSAADSTRGMVP
jgi:uncharacterized membrane-anchored protein